MAEHCEDSVILRSDSIIALCSHQQVVQLQRRLTSSEPISILVGERAVSGLNHEIELPSDSSKEAIDGQANRTVDRSFYMCSFPSLTIHPHRMQEVFAKRARHDGQRFAQSWTESSCSRQHTRREAYRALEM